jgi:hypothetical protein
MTPTLLTAARESGSCDGILNGPPTSRSCVPRVAGMVGQFLTFGAASRQGCDRVTQHVSWPRKKFCPRAAAAIPACLGAGALLGALVEPTHTFLNTVDFWLRY